MTKAFIAMKGDPAEGEWNEVYSLAHSTFRPYAEKHGYDFLPLWYENVDAARWPGLISGRPPAWHHDANRSHPYWLKIPAIIETLEKSLVVTNRKRGVTLSAGTDIPGAQVQCIEINAAHPTMSGLVASVVELSSAATGH